MREAVLRKIIEGESAPYFKVCILFCITGWIYIKLYRLHNKRSLSILHPRLHEYMLSGQRHLHSAPRLR